MTHGSGRLDLSILGTLYRYELKMLLRDRRTILIAVVAPLLLFPAIILVMRMAEERNREALEATTFRYAVTGSQAAFARTLIDEALALPPDSTGDDGAAAARFAPGPTGEPDSLLEAGELHLIVEALSAAEYRREREAADTADHAEPAAGGVAVPVLRLLYREDSERSSTAADRLAERLRDVRALRRDRILATRGLPVAPAAVASVEPHNIASAADEGGALLGLFLTPLLVLLLLSGGSIVAVDAITGEKERGTLENLLTTAARRGEIVASKQLAVITVGVAITVINIANLLAYLGIGLIDVPENLAVAVGPVALLVLLLLFLPVAALVSSALLLLSGYAKSYKEYQIYFLPLSMLFLLPAAAAILPDIELRSVVALVPLASVSVAAREVLTGEFDWPFLGLAFVTTSAAALWAARLTSRLLSTERLITAAELERSDLIGGPALFPRHVLRWYAALWGVFIFVSLGMAGVDVRGQAAVNLLGIFLGGSLLILRRYRLDPREALALRRPPAAAWLAVLIGAPSGLMTALGIARLLTTILPVPESMKEAFGRLLLPEDLPIAQVVLFLCVLPGICEEIAFRGVLLHGLSRRLSPVATALVVGLIFAIFHFSLDRLGPTAFLGITLAAVVMITGSIFPAMLWHALNNTITLLSAYYGWWPEGGPPWWAYALSVVGLALAFAILWRTRSPYPGLRRAKRPEAAAAEAAPAAP
ncbi:MAG TPA: CPBP family glutamic-type intramembrane protease [Longimicrobiales bacterium]